MVLLAYEIHGGHPMTEKEGTEGKAFAEVEKDETLAFPVVRMFLVGKVFHEYPLFNLKEIREDAEQLNAAAESYAREWVRPLIFALELAVTYMRPSVEASHLMDGFQRKRNQADEDLEGVEKVLGDFNVR